MLMLPLVTLGQPVVPLASKNGHATGVQDAEGSFELVDDV